MPRNMKAALAVFLFIGLNNACEHIDARDVVTAAVGAGAAAGGFVTHLAISDRVEAVPAERLGDGGVAVDWPDAGGPCAGVADRVCCTPEAIRTLIGPAIVLAPNDAGVADGGG